MKISKRILKNPYVENFLCWLASKYIRFVFMTTKWDLEGQEYIDSLAREGKPFILAFWHGRLLMIPPPFMKYSSKVNVLISEHKDGELIAKVMKFFDFKLIRGSTSRNALRALKEAITVLRNNEIAVFTPDGPRGPRMRVGGNIIGLARKMEVPIIPVTYAVSRCKLLRSWDRFMLAYPFGRGAYLYSKPIYVNDLDDEKAGKLLENSLNILTEKADRSVGITPVQPENL